jgi:hypothetical protein
MASLTEWLIEAMRLLLRSAPPADGATYTNLSLVVTLRNTFTAPRLAAFREIPATIMQQYSALPVGSVDESIMKLSSGGKFHRHGCHRLLMRSNDRAVY